MIYIILGLGVLATILVVWGSKVIEGLSHQSMYNVASCLIVASIITGVISFSSMYAALSFPDRALTPNTVTESILGVLVTILIGWNILSVVDFKKKAEKVDEVYSDFEHVTSGIMQLNMNSFLLRDDKDTLLDNCFMSLDEILKCKNSEIGKKSVNDIMYLIYKVCEVMKEKGKCRIYKGKRLKYLHILRHIDNEYREYVTILIEEAIDDGDPDKKNFIFSTSDNGSVAIY